MLRRKRFFAWISCFLFLCAVGTARVLSLGIPTEAPAKASEGTSAIALMYHHLLPRAKVGRYRGNNIVTYTEDFEAQLDLLQRKGCTVITPAELEAFFYEHKPLPDKAVLITFDDGYLSNAAYAVPLLRAHQMTAVVFAVTGMLGDREAEMNPQQIQMLSPHQIRGASDTLIFASHTHNLHLFSRTGHSALTDCSTPDFESDLTQSLLFLQTVPRASLSCFSYPYGLYTETVKQGLAKQGVRLAFRASGGIITADSDPYLLPRYPVDSSISLAQFERYLDGILR